MVVYYISYDAIEKNSSFIFMNLSYSRFISVVPGLIFTVNSAIFPSVPLARKPGSNFWVLVAAFSKNLLSLVSLIPAPLAGQNMGEWGAVGP
jgi:hypothetical protein